MTPPDALAVLSLSDAVKILADHGVAVSRRTVLNWCHDRGLGHKVGGQWMIDEDRLRQFCIGQVPTRHNSYRTLCDALRQRRQALGLTQEEVADRVGLSSNMIARYENQMRQPSGFYLFCWAEALGYRLTLEPILP